MFNSKRIIFLIGLLSLVTLTGALLAGPAFASKPDRGSGALPASHRTDICHYNGAAEFDAGLDGIIGTLDDTLVEDLGWYLKQVDADSVEKHKANHGDTSTNDFEIMFEDEGEFEGQDGVYDSAADCMRLDPFIEDQR